MSVATQPLVVPERYLKAAQIKAASSLKLTLPEVWNPDLPPKGYQVKGAAWMYFAMRAMLADQVGLGKLIETLLLVSMLKGLGKPYRTLVVCPKSVQPQWVREARRFTKLSVAAARGEKAQRVMTYTSRVWDVCVTTWPLILRDYEYLKAVKPDLIVLDESSAIRTHAAKTSKLTKLLTRGTPRIIELNATPTETSLLDLHSQLEALHMGVFGELSSFEHRHVRREPVRVKRGSMVYSQHVIVGYRNVDEFKERIRPFILRRRATDPEIEAELPGVTSETVWLELPPEQRRRYEEARRGIIKQYKDGQRGLTLRAHFHHVQQACDSTIAFGDEDPVSVKLDWILNALQGDLAEDKVVVFSQYKATLRDFERRLSEAKIGYVTYTGDVSDDDRDAAVQAFWHDPQTRVIMGTSALERGLNLQRSAFLININMLWNPQRMVQLIGRLRRIGSEHARVVAINLMTADTLEGKVYERVSERAAVSEFVLDDEAGTDGLFDSIPEYQLMTLLGLEDTDGQEE